MTLLALIRKRDTGRVATAIPAIAATQAMEGTGTVARIAAVAVANPTEDKTAPLMLAELFHREAFEERAAICEFDGGLACEEAEAIAWHEDDRRRCANCLNIRPGGICKVAEPGGLVSAMKGYRPNQAVMQRCAGYRPCPDDPDRRPGRERWPELTEKGGE